MHQSNAKEGQVKMKQVYVKIVETETGEVVERMGPMDEAKADRVERGALINMDRDNFHTRQVESPR
jgi:hypothetical protein